MSPGKRDLVRYREVRRADSLDDQKSALAIQAANTALTQEELQELVLSQLKRIVWGSGTGHWNDDFIADAVPSLADISDASIDFLLDNEPTAETGIIDCAYTLTRTLGKVTREEWRRNDTTLIKSIDYSYASAKVTQEVRKVFTVDGATVLAQVTWSYSYSGMALASATMTRDV